MDFSAHDDAISRAVVFFGVLAYPQFGAGDDGPGTRFADALRAYGIWAARKQYGLGALRERGVETRPAQEWEGILARGGRRINRRINAYRLWAKRGVWIEGDLNGLPAAHRSDLLAANPQRSISQTMAADLERWRLSLRLDRPRGPADTEMVRRLRDAINESKPVLHMAWQLDRACFAVGSRSWRAAWFRSESWIDEAIQSAEQWRIDQDPYHQNGLAASELIELRY